jgi:hypothetical protein
LCAVCPLGGFGMDRGGSDKCNAADNDTFEKVKLRIYQRSLCIRILIGVTMRQILAVVASC